MRRFLIAGLPFWGTVYLITGGHTLFQYIRILNGFSILLVEGTDSDVSNGAGQELI
jgi:hypothetical protein